MTYIDYRESLLQWLQDLGNPEWIHVPAEYASYLQPGYRSGLAGKVELFDERGEPTELPDLNRLLVVQKGDT